MPVTISGTTGIAGVDGSAGTPAVQGGDSNTGIFFPAADTIAFAEGGAEVARFDSSGNLGIGTSSPGARLHVYGTSAETLRFQSTSSAPYQTFYNSSANRAGYIEWNTSALKIDAESGASSTIAFLTANNERARIDSSGNLLVGTTSVLSSAKVSIKQNADRGMALESSSTATSFQILFRNPNGEVGTISTSGTATAYNTSSDYRLKEGIAPMTGALAKVAALKPVTYKWKVDGSDGQGFIAHELQAVVPQCVTGEKDAVDADGNPIYQGIDTSFLVATLTAAIQELKAEVDALKAQLGAQA